MNSNKKNVLPTGYDGPYHTTKRINYYLVNGNPNHKVFGPTEKDAREYAPEGATLMYVHYKEVVDKKNTLE